MLIFSCTVDRTPDGTVTTTDGQGVQTELALFGEGFEPKKAVSYEQFLKDFEGKDSLDAVVKGTVESVCQAKGCWINIISEEEGNPEMFVKFKDYGFFMPKDCAGKKVILNGYAFKTITSVDELKHYAEDEGLSQEEIDAITEPEEGLNFMASGVILE